MGLFWHYNLSQRISDAAIQAEQGANSAQEARARVLDLEAKVSKLTLINHALFELISQRMGITEAELIDKVNEIDLRDGARDGKTTHDPPVICDYCGRSYSRRHNHCFYCGHVNEIRNAF